jgi:hypothetical protein
MRKEMGKTAEPVNIGIVDNDQTLSSKSLVDGLRGKQHLLTMMTATDDTQAIQLAREQQISVVIIIPQGYEIELRNKKSTRIYLYSIISSLSIASSVQRANFRNLLWSINQQVSESFIKELDPTMNPQTFREPI